MRLENTRLNVRTFVFLRVSFVIWPCFPIIVNDLFYSFTYDYFDAYSFAIVSFFAINCLSFFNANCFIWKKKTKLQGLLLLLGIWCPTSGFEKSDPIPGKKTGNSTHKKRRAKHVKSRHKNAFTCTCKFDLLTLKRFLKVRKLKIIIIIKSSQCLT